MKKNFLITGASSGLGEKFAILVADISKNMIIVGLDKKKLLKVVNKIKKINSKINIIIVIADLSSEHGLNKLFKSFAMQKKIKYVDVLLNSAANFAINKIEDVTLKDLKKDFQLNVISPFMISKYFGLLMKKNKDGLIFNIGSSSSYDSFLNTSVYCATKHAMLSISKYFNIEWRSHGVKSIFVAPASMKTRMGKKIKNQNFETFIDPNDVAKLMKNLIIDQSNSMYIEELKIKRLVYK